MTFRVNRQIAGKVGRPADWMRLVAGCLLLTLFVFLLMQGCTPPGPAGEVFRNNMENRIDATPLFYTDLETPTPSS
jgi:hypothetical protein